jgi:hypothetical protein
MLPLYHKILKKTKKKMKDKLYERNLFIKIRVNYLFLPKLLLIYTLLP